MSGVVLLIGVGLVVVSLIVLAAAIETVDEGDIRALMVSGEMRAVLEPGFHVVPPFVSTTHPIDPDEQTIETDDATVPVPDEFYTELRETTRR